MLNKLRLKSYVCHGRATPGQKRAYKEFLTHYQLKKEEGIVQFEQSGERYLEIGFGNGQALLALAQSRRDANFIGIETHKPGIGALCLSLAELQLTNVRLYHGDAVDFLTSCISDATFDGIQLFFPDPWPKRRHNPRRLIQPAFTQLLAAKLKSGGQLHLATDLEDYALHMMRVLSAENQFINTCGKGNFAPRSTLRPVITKFENRALNEGRLVFDLSFIKI